MPVLLAGVGFPARALASPGFGTMVPDLNAAYGTRVDSLYGWLFWLAVLLFAGTEGALILFVLLFRKKEGRKAHYSHGHPAAEWIWTLIPVAILAFVYVRQQRLWDFMRGPAPGPDPVTVQVFAEQFAWHFRYPGPDGLFGTADDVMTTNQLHVPVGRTVKVEESAKDVIHSLFIPEARLKQDAVPGMRSDAWFEMDEVPCWDLAAQRRVFFKPAELRGKKVALEGFVRTASTPGPTGFKTYRYVPFAGLKKVAILYEGKIARLPVAEAQYVQCPLEIACAQLCGIGHYRMIGYLTVDSPESYAWWMGGAVKEKRRDDGDKWTGIWDKYYPQFNRP